MSVAAAGVLVLLRARADSLTAAVLCTLGLVAGATTWGAVRASVAGPVALVGVAVSFVLAVLVVFSRAEGAVASPRSSTR